MNKVDDMLAAVKLGELIGKKKEEEEKDNQWKIILIVIGVLAIIAVVAYVVYRFMKPDYLEDFDEDFDDDFDDDFFDDEDLTVDESAVEKKDAE